MDKINIPEIRRLMDILKRAQGDRLVAFVANEEADQLEQMRENNLRLLFKVAKSYKIRYLFVGKGEISGCEGIRTGTWPAMWAVAEKVGFPGSCGHGDQYQCLGSEFAFPVDSYGGWDLVENRKLSDDETKEKKFFRVVTRERGEW